MEYKLRDNIQSLKPFYYDVSPHAHTDQAIFVMLKHDRDVIKRLRVKDSILLFSIAYICVNENSKDEKGFYDLETKIYITWLDETTKGYATSFSEKMRQYSVPRKIEKNGIFKWNPNTNEF
jgi:hypothetical protein